MLETLSAARRRQRVHHLLDEEGVAARSLADEVGEIPDRIIRPYQLVQELAARFLPQGRQRQLVVVRSPRPGGPVLGTEVGDEQRGGAPHRRHQLSHQRVTLPIDPVGVVEQQDERLARTPEANEAPEEGGDPLVATRRDGRRVGLGHPEEIEEEGERARRFRVDGAKLIRDLLPDDSGQVGGLPPIRFDRENDGHPTFAA